MSVSLYLGLPGDGKSMAGMRKVVDWLLHTDCSIVTNLPIECGELQSYLWAAYSKQVDVLSRVVLLGQEQVRKFWLVRGDGWRMVDLEDNAWQHNQYPSLQRVYRWSSSYGGARTPIEKLSQVEVDDYIRQGAIEEGDAGTLKLGALYVIDECQNFWPARSFQTTPKGLLFYLSQHRHAGDECVFITQKEAQVEKTIRNLVLEYWVYRNLGQRRRMGFKLPGIFGYACYDQPPATPGAQFVGCGTFRMDVKGLAQCYRTADGVGVGGPSMLADTKARRTGLPWQLVIVAIAAIMVVAYYVPGWLTAGVKAAVTRGAEGSGKLVAGLVATNAAANQLTVVTSVVTVPVVAQVASAVSSAPGAVPAKAELVVLNTNRIAGAFLSSEGWWVQLTSGKRLGPREYYFADAEDGNLRRIQEKPGAEWVEWR